MSNIVVKIVQKRSAVVRVITKGPVGGPGGPGEPGGPGPAGTMMNWRGAWSTNSSYLRNDGVQYEGSGWVALQNNTGIPPEEGLYWSLFASRGDGAEEAYSALAAHTARTDNPHAVTAAHVGLGNVDNTSDADKPVSTATATALAGKAPLASPAFTGTPTVPTAANGTNNTQAASTAFVAQAISSLIASAPGALDTLAELATAMGNDPNFSATLTNLVAAKAAKGANLSDLTDPAAAFANIKQNATTLAAGVVLLAAANESAAGKVCQSNDPRLSDTRTPTAHTHAQSEVNGLVAALAALAPLASPALTGTPTAPTAVGGTNSTQVATTAFVVQAVAALVNSSPATLDTLNELAAALGNDPSFATTIATALGNKVDKVSGKGLSTEDFTSAEKTKLAGVAAGAEVNVNADWNATSGDAQILNKPNLGGAAVLSVGTTAGTVAAGDHSHDTATTGAAGFMSAADKTKLDELSNYTLPTASDSTLGGIKIGGGLSIDGNGVVSVETETKSITLVVDGGGAAITAGVKGYIQVPFACTIQSWRMFADQSGSITIDIWKDTYASFPPTDADSMSGGGKEPALSSAQKAEDTDVTDWTTDDISAGDILAFNVDALATSITRVTLQLFVRRTS